MKQKLVDTNILIRFLTGDDPKQASEVERKLRNAEKGSLVLPDFILCEMVWVLLAVYKLTKAGVVEKLEGVVAFEAFSLERKLVKKALEIYANHSISFVDALLLARGKISEIEVWSFDERMGKVVA